MKSAPNNFRIIAILQRNFFLFYFTTMTTIMRTIITGATGMVGEGVLHECLQHPDVEAVLVLGRKSCGVQHAKLTEILHSDLSDISSLKDRIAGYDACFFCAGVSSVGLSEEEYTRITYTLTLNFAQTLVSVNPSMTFCYVSGSGTDSSEQGRSMWARVKGKTENDLFKLPFKHVFAFRPGYMHPTPGLKNTLSFVKYVSWLYPIVRMLTSNVASTLAEVGIAMISVAQHGSDKRILEVRDIIALGKA
jgi:NAD dependent epimerase/dehydratase family